MVHAAQSLAPYGYTVLDRVGNKVSSPQSSSYATRSRQRIGWLRCTGQFRAFIRGLGTVGQWIDATECICSYHVSTVVATTQNDATQPRKTVKVTPSSRPDMYQAEATSGYIESQISALHPLLSIAGRLRPGTAVSESKNSLSRVNN